MLTENIGNAHKEHTCSFRSSGFILKWITMLCRRRILKMLLCSFSGALKKNCVRCDFVMKRCVCVCVWKEVNICTVYTLTEVRTGRRKTKSDDWDWNVPRICDYIQNDTEFCARLVWFCALNDANTKRNLKQSSSVVECSCSLTVACILVCLRFKNRQHFTPY